MLTQKKNQGHFQNPMFPVACFWEPDAELSMCCTRFATSKDVWNQHVSDKNAVAKLAQHEYIYFVHLEVGILKQIFPFVTPVQYLNIVRNNCKSYKWWSQEIKTMEFEKWLQTDNRINK